MSCNQRVCLSFCEGRTGSSPHVGHQVLNLIPFCWDSVAVLRKRPNRGSAPLHHHHASSSSIITQDGGGFSDTQGLKEIFP